MLNGDESQTEPSSSSTARVPNSHGSASNPADGLIAALRKKATEFSETGVHPDI